MKRGIYKHYKNKEYEVLGVAKDTDDLNGYVVYRALYNNEVSNLWVRKLDEFNQKVIVDGVEIPRFTYISEVQDIKFRGGGYNVLSNFSAFKIIYNNKEWMTSEHAYQASKFTDENIQNEIQEAPSAYEAMVIAQKYTDKVRSDWHDVSLSVMKEIITEKAKQHLYIQKKLLASENLTIIEDTDNEFWGRGENGDGQNMLGKLWMELREKLQSDIEYLKQKLLDEGFPVVYEWFDEAETIYEKHEHQDKVSFYIIEGNLTMNFEDKSIALKKGDRFDVPPKTQHSAVVGTDGCRYVVGQMTEEDA